MADKKQSNLKSIILQLGVVLLIVAGYFTLDFNKLYQSLKGEVKYITQNEQCDLHQTSCTIKIQDGTEFTLSVEPKTIPLMKPLKFTIKSNNKELKNLTLSIYATNMFMGEFNLPIKNLGNGNYEAIGTLPTCPVGNMQWNADIKIEKATENIGARFQFKTDI
ncbi:hypothetical protein [Halarcobacter sp.]|uniref:hypothetical protein n=1 Tax=Halarcobacter TaxID=2321115 RepID=UPI003A941036